MKKTLLALMVATVAVSSVASAADASVWPWDKKFWEDIKEAIDK